MKDKAFLAHLLFFLDQLELKHDPLGILHLLCIQKSQHAVMADVQSAQPADAHNAQAAATTQETAPQQTKTTAAGGSFLGDNLIPDAEMVYDQKRTSEFFVLKDGGF